MILLFQTPKLWLKEATNKRERKRNQSKTKIRKSNLTIDLIVKKKIINLVNL